MDVRKASRFRFAPRAFSKAGLLAALFFFGLSITPSLLPRHWIIQSAVSGIVAAVGYGLAVGVVALARYLRVPSLRHVALLWAGWVSLGVGVVFSAWNMWDYTRWQNDQRSLFGMDTVSPTIWLAIIPVALIVSAILVFAARGVRHLIRAAARQARRVLPERVAAVLAVVAVIGLLFALTTGVLGSLAFDTVNRAFGIRDTVTPSGIEQPTSSTRSGSPVSLVSWDSLGRQGKSFVAGGPSAAEIQNHMGGDAEQPIRVYASLRSEDSAESRARLVLDELKRTGAFDRAIMVLATTTGTGFVDPEAAAAIELIYGGDTAIGAIQYSYLPSWISLVADPSAADDAAKALFSEVRAYWRTLPQDDRPRLYLFGMSLGSFGVESVLSSIDLVADPPNGILLAGPPFINEVRNEVTANRDAGSPAWLPKYRNGSTVRFMSTDTGTTGTAPWEGMRVLYLQHASDPMSFFSTDLLFAYPDWLKEGERGPDVSSEMLWFPVVTMWQVAFDLPTTGMTPRGHGHLFTANEYVDAWVALTDPPGWSSAASDHAKGFFSQP